MGLRYFKVIGQWGLALFTANRVGCIIYFPITFNTTVAASTFISFPSLEELHYGSNLFTITFLSQLSLNTMGYNLVHYKNNVLNVGPLVDPENVYNMAIGY